MRSNRPFIGAPVLCLLPRILFIKILDEATVQSSAAIDRAVMNILEVAVNIVDLFLNLPDLNYFYREECLASFTFKLKYLSFRAVEHPGLYEFLHQQDEIEDLAILNGNELSGPGTANLLPRIRSLTAGPISVYALVSGRPVSKIRIGHVNFAEIETAVSVMTQASAPFLSLGINTAPRDKSDCNIYCTKWLSSLSRFHKTLHAIDFEIVLTPGLVAGVSSPAALPVCVTIEPDGFVDLLRAFNTLR